MKKRYALMTSVALGPVLVMACVASPDTTETEEADTPAPEEQVGEAQSAATIWTHISSLRMGGTGNETTAEVATDSGGNRIVVGTFSGSMTVGSSATTLTSAGGTDAYVVRLSPAGSVLWSRRLGSTGNDTATAVAVDGSNNVIIVGQMAGPVDFGGGPVSGTSYVVKLNSCGTHVWSKGFTAVQPTAFSDPRDVAANSAGTIVIGGMQSGAMDYGGGNILSTGPDNYGPFVQSLASDGSWLWGHGGTTEATIEPEAVKGVAIDGSGNVAVTGDHRFGQTLGCTTSALMPYSDMYVIKLSSTGACSWSAVFGATDGLMFDRGVDVAFGANGAVVAAGHLDGPGTIGGTAVPGGGFLVSLTSAGAFSWVRSLGPGLSLGGIATDTSGNIAVGGHFTGTINVGGSNLSSAGGFDVFFARYSSVNVHLWSERYGNSVDQYTTGVAFAPNGNATFVGFFSGSMSFGGSTLASAGGSDLFVARYGNVVVP